MSNEWRVVVEGGGANLYKIREYDDNYHVYQITVHIPFDDKDSIGEADSLELALALIRSHSGEEIKKITEI